LPMSTEEFDGRRVDELQREFFRDDLPTRPKGQYRYYTYGLKAPVGTALRPDTRCLERRQHGSEDIDGCTQQSSEGV